MNTPQKTTGFPIGTVLLGAALATAAIAVANRKKLAVATNTFRDTVISAIDDASFAMDPSTMPAATPVNGAGAHGH